MTYQVRFTEQNNPSKPAIVVDDQTINTTKSVTFVGKNYAGYAPYIAENFLHLLENFAKSTPPSAPVEGQLWYDNTTGVNLLKIWDGTTWTAAGAVKKAGSAPAVANSIKGDLWVDTNNQQLYIFSGSNWLLVGPQYSSGVKTGPEIETIVDTDNVSHAVLTTYAGNQRVSITSETAFTPKAAILGFTSINKGVNITSVDASSTTTPTKFWGTAKQADALVVGGVSVSAASFLRGDTDAGTTVSNIPISVRNNNGINIGSDLSFNIGSSTTSSYLYSLREGNSIDLKISLLNSSTSTVSPTTIIHVDGTSKVGIGINNTSPAEALDVLGNIKASGEIYTVSTEDSTLVGTGSLVTTGGLSVAKNSNFGGNVNVFGTVNVNNLDVNSDPQAGPVILPGSTSADLLYDIGSPTQRFRNVYAETFTGNFSIADGGSFYANNVTITGSVSDSAGYLASPTRFSIGDSLNTALSAADRKSDVISNTVSFDGRGDDPVIFTAKITPDFITNKTEASSVGLTDTLLIYRPGTTGGLRKATKAAFLSTVPTVPIGAIFPYAGATPPAGYLLCDGSEVLTSVYPLLFSVIQYTYTVGALQGEGTFALPDLRGRFALGKDNMENVDTLTGLPLTVPVPGDPNNTLDAGGGSANRVTDPVADILGGHSGSEDCTLDASNLPDHKHNLNSGLAQYYASGIATAGADTLAVEGLGMSTTAQGYGLPNSGGILGVPNLAQPFTSMNPYLAINYIIFTGAI